MSNVTCARTREQLTAYLDGELDGDRGSAVRGHLRTCEACRTVATDEAALRDGLRTLPTVDPPASLWAGVQARLAAAEMADAEQPAWRRATKRWLQLAMRPQLGFAGLAIAAGIAILAWRYNRHADGDHTTASVVAPTMPGSPAIPPSPAPSPPVVPEKAALDVTADLAGEAARASQDYAATADELLQLAQEPRGKWSDDRKHAFDARVVELRHSIDSAPEGRQRHKAYRTLIRYLQGAAVRDEVAMVSVEPPGAP